jgi:hypothetical protein
MVSGRDGSADAELINMRTWQAEDIQDCSSICEHGRQKTLQRISGGSGMYDMERKRNYKECGGAVCANIVQAENNTTRSVEAAAYVSITEG